MKQHIKTLLVMSSLSGVVYAEEQTGQQITRVTSQKVQSAPSSDFSGKAQFSRLPQMPSEGDIAPALVQFEAGAITHWHTHPHGQYLIVTEGEGRTQEWGKPIQIIRQGDVVWCPPNVKHWHGASEQRAMSHIALSPVVQDGKNVVWLEEVSFPSSERTNTPSSNTFVTLEQKQLSLIPIAAFTATGDLVQLKPALIQALDNGLTVNQMKEIFAHQSAYVGFPRALNGMLTFKSVLEERKKQGIKDEEGALPHVLADSTSYYQRGIAQLSALNKASVAENSKPLFDNFSPTMDYALKSHLFGYLFSRDNLSPLDRELVVIGSLSALGGVNAQLRSHLKITQNLGVHKTEMQRIIVMLRQSIGEDWASNTQNVFNEI
ncbi:carboxymuconolactone decarboxylase family protein [Acinetobacter sp. B5B]|uniref:(R)-mandelonitrile lyase n=1 Tax=Acinetobacter baretiae TaxID=2605383 RepID=UPI0018C32DB9|nr:carboxymuconolactone decarboxylase family protein [Acinetobacter baretiae]MBF7681885.1 carboxymuconolactone decarboxylase family protein [Acinetobacter baretiae]